VGMSGEVRYSILKDTEVKIRVYDVTGRKVKEERRRMKEGEYREVMELGRSGVYFLEVETPYYKGRKKFVYIK